MTLSPRAIEAALDKWHEKEDATDKGQQTAMRSALTAALAVDGLCLVPKEPPDDVLKAGYEAMFDDKYNGTQAPLMFAVWEAMLDAASTPRQEKP